MWGVWMSPPHQKTLIWHRFSLAYKVVFSINLQECLIVPGLHHVKEVPFSVCLWYPGGSPRSSWLRHQVALFFTLILPAYFVDLIMILLRKKTFMVNVQKRIRYGMECMRYFTTKEWHFKNDNLRALRQKVSPEDNKTFFTDMKVINWNSYMRVYVKGVRKYILKEDPSTLPQARRLQRQ
ncbi:hypothetical protein evm_000315 [Chilo suppressalis]|nr:hypothetical protein evm_000315 [Chilo suppressalis]